MNFSFFLRSSLPLPRPFSEGEGHAGNALSLCLSLSFQLSADSFHFILSFVPSLFLSLHLSLCLPPSAAVPVGVKPGECDRKREAAGREMKGCVEAEEKGNGDNEKSDLGSPAPTDPFHNRTFAESIDTQLQTRVH